ncbi:MAG: Dam family site-specific DNA-(adenine-N6)-methyltransferase [Candidatus Omnitrophica bacterium]|nr:Dam family site-specific DNA-(adenine-N6)-methyltransferase [Candidatus Omnitrophota bacterium]
MNPPPLVPPLKCQGIKTRLAGEISRIAHGRDFDRWVEPFCGSCVAAFNVGPSKALLGDSNIHIIRLYQEIQDGSLTPAIANAFLVEEGEQLRAKGAAHYYAVRERFNTRPTSLDFLFLNRSCFNGVVRFNRQGGFNVPYGHKSERFRPAYVTKITNQIRRIFEVISANDWTFVPADFRNTLALAKPGDLIYADPPYAGRHVDYFNSWSASDETELVNLLKRLPCGFILSTWHSNQFRTNSLIDRQWNEPRFHFSTQTHFYHVGSARDFRHPIVEAFVTNFPVHPPPSRAGKIEGHCEDVGRTSGLPVNGASGSASLGITRRRAGGPVNRQTGGLPHGRTHS